MDLKPGAGAPSRLERVGRMLLVLSVILGAAGLLLLRGQAETVASPERASTALVGLYASWLLLASSLCLGIIASVKSRRFSWWTVVGAVVLVGLSWLVGCAVPAAMLR